MSDKLTVGIIGYGTMGSGIAQVAATADCKVMVYETNRDVLTRSDQKLKKILARLVEKGKIDQAKSDQISGNIKAVDKLLDFGSCDLVIEAIIEDPEVKKNVFSELENYVSGDCIIASNTSSLSIASLAASCANPGRFVGIHFFNPAPLMHLVELVPAIQTDASVVQKAKSIIDSWGKSTVLVKDTPGFIVNRVARPFYGEALRIYEEGLADFATIDWAMKEIGGFRMGPFELMDFIGNDINYIVTETVFEAFYYDPRYQPSFTQKRFYEAGFLGRKSGRGYYSYQEGANQPEPKTDKGLGQHIFDRILVRLINEAADAVHFGVASKEDIDLAMTKGVNYPKGLLAWADDIGIDNCVHRMDTLFNHYHETQYRCSPLLRAMMETGQTFYQRETDHAGNA